ncbi:TPA: hypothetical protein DIS56_02805 [Candidatus Saccharibacteria bacterium]|nr:MAG: MIP family channel protein [Candidatus Saccharibacteria bacterium GW2011_GWA2_46_10]OGL35857.1 MAG: hypothetical protein A3F05_00760 [Candidatus Saccharibacteria bacterium RIFCSPHIGHO2_12_FULL_47_17]HCM52038.1 hypothetical protein [Candidatus Saccharibacteria bacterium]
MLTLRTLAAWPNNVAAPIAEFLGTAILTMTFLIMAGYAAFPFYIGLSAAIALMVVYVMFGKVSGAHANPALTFGLWTARKVPTLRAIVYIASQMLGGLAAWQLFQYIASRPLPAASVEFSGPVWIAEAVGTAVLAGGLCAALSRGYDAFQTAMTYGAALFIGLIIAALALTSSQGFIGYINPAVALGLRHWGTAYVFGPLLGALVGVNLYYWLFADSKNKK